MSDKLRRQCASETTETVAETAGKAVVRCAQSAAESILRMIGLAKRAGKLAIGTDAVLNAVRVLKGSAIVMIASDASPRTTKQITDKCSFYGVTLVSLDADRSALAAALG